jgi:hypothetical protein
VPGLSNHTFLSIHSKLLHFCLSFLLWLSYSQDQLWIMVKLLSQQNAECTGQGKSTMPLH